MEKELTINVKLPASISENSILHLANGTTYDDPIAIENFLLSIISEYTEDVNKSLDIELENFSKTERLKNILISITCAGIGLITGIIIF